MLMLKYLTFACFLYLNLNILYAQAGFYKYTQKDFTETLELLENGNFIYNNLQDWSKTESKGKWKIQNNQLILHSEHQIQFELIEEEDNKKECLYLVITSTSKDKGPQKINQILINGNGKMMNDNSNSLAYLEKHSRIMNTGTKAQRDSLKEAYIPLHYLYDDYSGTVENIEIFFDKRKVNIPITNPKANHIKVIFNLEGKGTYRYFNQEAWTFVNKKEILSKEGQSFKRAKK